jgi:UDP-N-acetylglucosamine--N-acetylmuramyl-(pentapeptide) pyrophosphoryl-undecaprenol N-acetylglucosamine transferase
MVSDERRQAQIIVVTGGNTGGHVIPNIPIIEELRAYGWSVHYIGDPNGLEARLIPDLGVPFHPITTGKWRRYMSVRNITDISRTMSAVCRAVWFLRRLHPLLVYSKGGFVAVPVMIAAWLLRIPIVAHESDRTLSLTGKLALRFADTVCCGLPPLVESPKLLYTGIPLRRDLNAAPLIQFCSELQLRPSFPVLLVVGGSLGAAGLDALLHDALPSLLKKFDIIHLSGNTSSVTAFSPLPGYHPIANDYKRFPALLATADLVLSRAGATTIVELIAVRKPALLVPLPFAASRGEQLANARYFQEAGYGEYREQAALTSAELDRALSQLLVKRKDYTTRMAATEVSDGTNAVLAVIHETVSHRGLAVPSQS